MGLHTSRRTFLRTIGLGGAALLAAACSPTPSAPAAPPPAAPPPSVPPAAKPTEAPAKPAAAAPTTAAVPPAQQAPVQPTAAGASVPANADWPAVVDAAKKEGHLVLATYPGTGYKRVVDDFSAAYPGIAVEQTSFQTSSRDFLPRFFQERQAGLFAWDLILMPANEMLNQALPVGALDPLRPLLVHPEVLDDKGWRDGFEGGWLDKPKQFAYGVTRSRSQELYWNTDLVKDGEISRWQDLLDPKWKGKIIGGDPRTKGSGFWVATALRLKLNDDGIIQKLWKDQEVLLSTDARQLTEAVIRGKYPVGLGAVSKPILVDFLAQGIGTNLKTVPFLETDVVNSSDHVMFFVNKAPNPKAAQLFANWLLTKAGSDSYAKNTQDNSRRADVPVIDPEIVPEAGVDYIKIDSGIYLDEILKTQQIAKDVLN